MCLWFFSCSLYFECLLAFSCDVFQFGLFVVSSVSCCVYLVGVLCVFGLVCFYSLFYVWFSSFVFRFLLLLCLFVFSMCLFVFGLCLVVSYVG